MSTLDEHDRLTGELVDAIHTLATIKAHSLRAFSETWRQTSVLGVTERRETCKDATVEFDIETTKLQGDIDALHAQLHYLELVLAHGDATH